MSVGAKSGIDAPADRVPVDQPGIDPAPLAGSSWRQEVEGALSQAGRFALSSTEVFDHFEAELRLDRYIADPQHSRVLFLVRLLQGRPCCMEASLAISSPMPARPLRQLLQPHGVQLLKRRHGVSVSVADSVVRIGLSTQANRSGAIQALLAGLFEALHTAHGVMRRAGAGRWLLAPDPREFWGESVESANARTEQLQTTLQHLRIHNLAIRYTEELAGGGQMFEPEAMQLIAETIGPVDRAYEWCAGPGFLGFSLLARGLCQKLCLSDLNPRAVAMCRETAAENKLGSAVSVYESDCLDQIPPSQQWDLIIGNPPWRKDAILMPSWGRAIKYQDRDLQLHRRFFASVGRHTTKGSQILLIESYITTEAQDFRDMVEAAGLTIKAVRNSSRFPMIYFLWIASSSLQPG